jgi:hypothetical protein
MEQPASIRNKPYVYKLSYSNGVVFYIGKGKNGRINEHEREARRPDTKQYNMYKSRVIRKMWKNGEEVLKEIIAYFDTEEEAHDYEMALIFFMRPYGYLTNITDGGEGHSGHRLSEESIRKMSITKRNAGKITLHSEETKNKIRASLTGRKRSEDTVQKMREANIGKKHSEETRRKMSDKGKGREVTEEIRRKLSETLKGHVVTEEVRRKLSEAGTGKTHSEETRRKMRQAHKGEVHKPVSEEARRRMSEAKKGRKRGAMSEETRRKISEAHLKRRLNAGKEM